MYANVCSIQINVATFQLNWAESLHFSAFHYSINYSNNYSFAITAVACCLIVNPVDSCSR